MASTRKPRSADLQIRVRDFLATRIFPHARLCLGYSGGLDSTVLLHLLAGLRQTLDFELGAVHVHHGLSPNADVWVSVCEANCRRLDVPLEVHRVSVVADGEGIEAAARAARYAVFAGQSADFVLVAHHGDDQAETLLLRLLRGAGVHGLSAMAEERGLAGMRLLRPLLDVAREELLGYARLHRLVHVEDESNVDLSLSRNWLRRRVLPELEARFPAGRVVLARTADRLAESAELLDDLARLDLVAVENEAGLDLAELGKLGEARARNLLRYWLRARTGTAPYAAHLDELLGQLLNAAPGRQPFWHWGGKVLHRHRGRVGLVPDLQPASGEWVWRGESDLALGEHGRLVFHSTVGEGLAADRLPESGGVVGWRVGGEKLKPDCRRPRRTLKNLLREAGLAPFERLRLPLLTIDGRPAWVAGIGVDCDFQAGLGEPGWLISWLPRGQPCP